MRRPSVVARWAFALDVGCLSGVGAGCSSANAFRHGTTPVGDEVIEFGGVPSAERTELIARRDAAGVGVAVDRPPRAVEQSGGLVGVDEPPGYRRCVEGRAS